MPRDPWRTAARCAASAVFFFVLCASTARASGSFDLAVQEVDVRQIGSTPMFREVAVRCVVSNHGPGLARATAWVVISRPGDDGPKVLKKVAVPPLGPGE